MRRRFCFGLNFQKNLKMATIRQFLDNLRRAKAEMIANREAEALKISLDQIALVKLRIQRKGENAQGAQFSPYTPDYAKNRKKAGYQIGFVDFTRTGKMWAAIQPKVVESNVFRAVVELEGRDEKTRAMLRGHENKRGNILSPNATERAIIANANRERVLKYLNFLK